MTIDHHQSVHAPLSMQSGHHSITPSKHAKLNWKLPDTPSDLIIKMGCISFALHKFPLLSKCGLLKMLVEADTTEEPSKVELEGIPGGAEGFELAAKFCYGMNPEMSKHNVALLRCVAEFLDMSEDQEQGNLISQTEDYLGRLMSKHTFKDTVTILHTCESLLPMAEDLGIVSRCIDWIVSMAMHERKQIDESQHTLITFQEFQHNMNNNIEWWVEDLSVLGIHFYQKVLLLMKHRGLRADAIGHALIYYAHKSLKSLTKKNLGPLDHNNVTSKVKGQDASVTTEHEQRVLVESIVSLLPREKGIASTNFLIGMLRIARILKTTLACRMDLEKRIASQLHRATLDDLLIPSYGNHPGESLFDVDTIHHLVASFIQQQEEHHDKFDDDDDEDDTSNDTSDGSASQSPIVKVGKLVDGYLVEIAADFNLALSKFIGLAELLPKHARPESDGLYRAIDMYMKTHPSMTDVEKKKICRLIDFQKLSAEACTHAAQNERLPVQAVVQVLYFEQMRIRNVVAGTHYPCHNEHPFPQEDHHFPHGHHFSPHAHGHHTSPLGGHHQSTGGHHGHHQSPEGHGHHQSLGGHHQSPGSHGRHQAPQSHGHHQSLQGHHHNRHGPLHSDNYRDGHHHQGLQDDTPFIHKISNGNLCAALTPNDQYASVRMENKELKLEVARMKMRLNELEKVHIHHDTHIDEAEKAHHHHHHHHHQEQKKPHYQQSQQQQQEQLHHGGFFHAFSKSLSKLNPFLHHKLAPVQAPPAAATAKRRAKSMSVTSEQQPKREPSNKPSRRHSAATF